MFRYDFSDWEGQRFAKLCNALIGEFISDKVRPFFTSGPDGGRDSDYNGPGKGDYSDWEGYWIFQYKFHNCSVLGVKEARARIKQDLKAELQKISNNKPPDNYIMITNVPFSGVIKKGTHDWFREILEEYPAIKNAEVWDYTKIESLLDRSSEIRQNFFPSTGYGGSFVKNVIQEVSQSVLFETIEDLFNLTENPSIKIKPINRGEIDKVLNILWRLDENLTHLSKAFTTISNLIYIWPELARLQFILSNLHINNVKFEFGEDLVIETKGGLIFNECLEGEWIMAGPEGGTLSSPRTMYTLMRRLLKESERVSLKINKDIMFILERYPSVAKRIAGSAKKDFENGDYSIDEPLLSQMQYVRVSTVSEMTNALEKWIEQKQGQRSSLDPDLETRGKFYGAVEINRSLQKAIREILRNPMTLIKSI